MVQLYYHYNTGLYSERKMQENIQLSVYIYTQARQVFFYKRTILFGRFSLVSSPAVSLAGSGVLCSYIMTHFIEKLGNALKKFNKCLHFYIHTVHTFSFHQPLSHAETAKVVVPAFHTTISNYPKNVHFFALDIKVLES